jgi:hypothetical protein
VLVVLAFVAGLWLAAPAEAAGRYERPGVGLSVVVPDGWAVVRRPLTNCTDPVQRLALRGRGALVQLVERRDPSSGLRHYPARPARFDLPGRPEWVACCAPSDRKGWMFPFRDGSRAFYAYVYLGAPETRAEALRILDSLRVSPRREGRQTAAA